MSLADRPSGLEHGRLAADFNPTSDAGTGIAFAPYERQFRNTESGKAGVFCAICHSIAATRDTPYHTLARAVAARPEYVPARGRRRAPARAGTPGHLRSARRERANLGYAVGAGSFRLSPHAIGFSDRFGPLTADP